MVDESLRAEGGASAPAASVTSMHEIMEFAKRSRLVNLDAAVSLAENSPMLSAAAVSPRGFNVLTGFFILLPDPTSGLIGYT